VRAPLETSDSLTKSRSSVATCCANGT
jgi:hypothetical protein